MWWGWTYLFHATEKLMVWYTYFFLNRGKPATHIEAFSNLSTDYLKANQPDVFEHLFQAAERALKGKKQ